MQTKCDGVLVEVMEVMEEESEELLAVEDKMVVEEEMLEVMEAPSQKDEPTLSLLFREEMENKRMSDLV
ncbi:unnamed protein product [Boreogadus saida]